MTKIRISLMVVLLFSCSMVIVASADDNQFHILDISDKMNAGFTPNSIGTDYTDYKWIISGVHQYTDRNIPFTIVNPSANNGKGIVVSNGGTPIDPAYTYPHIFEFQVPSNFQQDIKKVHLLGISSGWGCSPYESYGTNGGSLKFEYSDGSTFSQPLRQGLEYDDWGLPHSSTNAIFAESGLSSANTYTHFDILTVNLQDNSAKNLEKIRLEDTGTIASIPIFAITLESSDTQINLVPEFPSLILPIATIIGLLGSIMFIQRITDQSKSGVQK